MSDDRRRPAPKHIWLDDGSRRRTVRLVNARRDTREGGVENVEAAQADGECPHCGQHPFLIGGTGAHIHDNETYVAGAYCGNCTRDVGQMCTRVETFFGAEEDEAIFNGRARVYS